MGTKASQLLISDQRGRIYDFPSLEAAGMKGGHFFRFNTKELIKLPPASRLFMVPQRSPVGYNARTNKFVVLDGYFAVSAFVSPGYTITYNSAYREINKPDTLPLFSYAAAAFYNGEFYAAATRVDKDRRHDCRFIDIRQVRENTARFKKIFRNNRLIDHLKDCALIHGCPNAQNFFLGRSEAPLPVSPYCNALCIGCISYQSSKEFPASQPRIRFVPTPQEISEIALFHIKNAKDPLVSFGQGCEGEPLLAAGVIEESIRLIRRDTSKGVININTNASKPGIIGRLFDAGLDSVRVSLNSARQKYYERYYKPMGYAFQDVLASVKMAKKKGGFVSINYLTMPGFTDSEEEFGAFKDFVAKYNIDMVQWRNLNFDPLRYFGKLKVSADPAQMLGVKEIIDSLKKTFPRLLEGYFNPRKLP